MDLILDDIRLTRYGKKWALVGISADAGFGPSELYQQCT